MQAWQAESRARPQASIRYSGLRRHNQHVDEVAPVCETKMHEVVAASASAYDTASTVVVCK